MNNQTIIIFAITERFFTDVTQNEQARFFLTTQKLWLPQEKLVSGRMKRETEFYSYHNIHCDRNKHNLYQTAFFMTPAEAIKIQKISKILNNCYRKPYIFSSSENKW